MKIRNGFVSNSSSSSFIIAFPKRPSSVEELESWIGKYRSNVASSLFNNIEWSLKEQGEFKIHHLWTNNYNFDVLDFIDKNSLTFDKIPEPNKNTYPEIFEFLEKYKDCFIHFCEYGDDGGGGLEEEVNGIEIPHLSFSHH